MALLTDLSGNPIPPDSSAGPASIPRYLAVPPVRDVPSELATEFTFTAFRNLGAGGTTFLPLTDPTTSADFTARVPDVYRGRLAALMLFCSDMVSDTAPYLTFQLVINGQLAPAWGNVPIYPRAGIAALGFEMYTDLAPNALIQLFGKNTDAANSHFLAVYLYGWFWPKDLQQG